MPIGTKQLYIWWQFGSYTMTVLVGKRGVYKNANNVIGMSKDYDDISDKEIEDLVIHNLNQNCCDHALSLQVRFFLCG